MATDKKIDPRFDPAFQRGYAEGGQGAHADAVRAARTVDSLRDNVADVQFARPARTVAAGGNQASAPERAASPAATTAHPSEQPASPLGAGLGLEQQWGPTPQSHYVDDAGALAESTPVTRGKSLARSPWIYVLWVIGGVGMVLGGGIQAWVYAVYYRFGSSSSSGIDWAQVAIAIAPGLMQLGAICIGLALLTHTLNWMRKNA
ncbi:hypothetical protein [Rhodoglobus sp.]